MILLVSFILLAALVGLTLRERENPTWPEALLIDAFGWVQGVVYAPVQHVAGFFEDIQNIKDIYEENARLKANLNDFSSMSVQIQDLERQNRKLKEDLAGLKDITGQLSLISANVVGRSPNTWNSVITIDVGTKDGVTKDMAVITANKGLVGRVFEATPYHSKVLLITDNERSGGISAKLLTDNEKDPVYGFIGGAKVDASQKGEAPVEMTNIALTADVKEGQAVVTSGLSDIFPPSLIIGKVTKVIEDPLGLTKTAKIEPNANLNYLEFVYVVKQAQTAK